MEMQITLQQIIDGVFEGFLNTLLLKTFTKVFDKEEAEEMLNEIFNLQLTEVNKRFERIFAQNIGASAEVEKALRINFENFKKEIMDQYRTKILIRQ